MRSFAKLGKKITSIALTLAVSATAMSMFAVTASAATPSISYSFTGDEATKAGYAQGTVSLTVDTAGSYSLYWANDTKALEGYYPITTLSLGANGTGSFTFTDHTAIPAGATKIIATSSTDTTVANAKAVYNIQTDKQLQTKSGSLMYKFSSISDVHIDAESPNPYYKNAEKNWKQALKYNVDKHTDFIVSSGDMVTNAQGPDKEWKVYEQALADSDYTNPVWEANGNHDLRTGAASGIKSFVKNSGTDSTIANYDANKPYYYMVEKTTGDVFIFMALESGYKPNATEEFSDDQMTWLTNLLEKYYNSGVNVYIIEHAPIKGFGAGDRMSNPYYQAHLSEDYSSTVQFKSLLQKYPKLIWMSGHTHEDFEMGYNYSNENDTAANMIHNSAVAGSTWAEGTATSLDYNNGYGRNSQGYYVEAYQNEIVYYGANLTDEKIYPAYTYIMEGSRAYTEPSTSKIGDVNNDGTVNVSDATTIQRAVSSQITLSATQQIIADVNNDGKCNVSDATVIQRYIAGAISEFPRKSINSTSATVDSISTGATSITDELTKVSALLTNDVAFASYDQYQALKKYYYQYKSSTTADASVITEFERLVTELNTIVEHISGSSGGGGSTTTGTYYFENTYNWSSVYAYAWTGSSNNGTWPGVALTKVGTNSGHDVYKVDCTYSNIIFSNGSGTQTVDIVLSDYSQNGFYISGTDSSTGKLAVASFTYGSTTSGSSSTTSATYVLNYYNGTAHAWYTYDTPFTANTDGTYSLSFTTKNVNDISFDVYNTSTATFNNIATSTQLTYAAGTTNTYALSNATTGAKGSSVTITGLSTGVTIKFTYNPTTKNITVAF